jgi:orotate phosphoribosyltransferase
MSAEFKTGYMDKALMSLDEVIEDAKADLADVDFDTIVGTGFSGGVVIPALALAMGKKFVLIRKESDDSHHGGGRLIGSLGDKWVFVDDFVSTGRTRGRVIEKVEAACVLADHQSTHVGDYMYANVTNKWQPVEEEDE